MFYMNGAHIAIITVFSANSGDCIVVQSICNTSKRWLQPQVTAARCISVCRAEVILLSQFCVGMRFDFNCKRCFDPAKCFAQFVLSLLVTSSSMRLKVEINNAQKLLDLFCNYPKFSSHFHIIKLKMYCKLGSAGNEVDVCVFYVCYEDLFQPSQVNSIS